MATRQPAAVDKKLHFPIKTVTNDGSEMDLTNIQGGTPVASPLEIPSSYRKVAMGTMMGGRPQQ